MISLNEALTVVQASKEHQVLKRLPELPILPVAENTHYGMYLDIESTGLDTNVDEIIEFGAIIFAFTKDGLSISPVKNLHWYNEPRKPITAEITKITGITPEMVAGKTLDVSTIEAALDSVDIVIAHNAAFDRPMCERVSKKFVDKYWGCSMSQVEWGTATRKLEYLLYTMGYFYKAHNALTDCQAGLFAIAHEGRLAQILEASRKPSYHVWAIDAPFEVKDDLKKRGYFWSAEQKSWHKNIPADAADDEETWLKHLYGRKTYRARFDRVTAKERFTKRG